MQPTQRTPLECISTLAQRLIGRELGAHGRSEEPPQRPAMLHRERRRCPRRRVANSQRTHPARHLQQQCRRSETPTHRHKEGCVVCYLLRTNEGILVGHTNLRNKAKVLASDREDRILNAVAPPGICSSPRCIASALLSHGAQFYE